MEYSLEKDSIASASAVRFQRASVAFLSVVAVSFNTPIPAYFIALTAGLDVLVSPKAELLGLFYRTVLKRIVKRDLFSFKHIFPGSFLLDPDAERFIFFIYIAFQGLGIFLYNLGIKWWTVPVAIVAAGTTMSAATGICLMAFMYALVKEWKNKPYAAS